uniref:Uncharacterized protein n=1 Tax=Octopus bimaculoides TaxID=37653 RepID=A0A0L8FV67_OCTBM
MTGKDRVFYRQLVKARTVFWLYSTSSAKCLLFQLSTLKEINQHIQEFTNKCTELDFMKQI